MTNRSQLRLSMLVPAVAAAITGCGGDNQPFVPPKPGNALIYTYPVEGMVDVPTASKALMVFSRKVGLYSHLPFNGMTIILCEV